MSFLPQPGRVKRDKDQFVRLFLYAEPGFGKSYFADQFPEPFIINTDGNLPYYTAPGLIVNQWEASKNDPESKNRSFVDVVDELVKNNGFGYKTIVVDLVEHVYELARQAKLAEYGLNHEADAGGYGKGYQLVRDPFFSIIKKLYSLPLNIILLSHENEKTIKDRIGREYTYFMPSLTDTVVKKLSGTGYTLRAYWKGSLTNDNMESKAKRMLSLTPKDNELHVARLVDADGNPVELDDIELSYENFINVLKNLNDPTKVGSFKTPETSVKEVKETKKLPPKKPVVGSTATKKAHTVDDLPVVEEVKVIDPLVVAGVEVESVEEPNLQTTIGGVVEQTVTNVTPPIQTTTTVVTSTITDEKKKKIEALKAQYLKGKK
jgi:hypothetical protein